MMCEINNSFTNCKNYQPYWSHEHMDNNKISIDSYIIHITDLNPEKVEMLKNE